MIVLRNIPTDATVSAGYIRPLLQWLQEVITTACSTRRNQRVSFLNPAYLVFFNYNAQPTHAGVMVQIGLNMGARHARVLGWAKSFFVPLSLEEKKNQDSDLIGAMSLFWALIKAFVPKDITDEVQALLDMHYPPLATLNIPPSKIYFQVIAI